MPKSATNNVRSPSHNDAPFRVLAVEDSRLFAQSIAMELERCGIACDLAFRAQEAVERCQDASYQAILLDHKLPDGDGIQLIPSLLGRQPACTVIVMTAYEGIRSAIQAIRLGAEDYLVKETSLQPIIDRIIEVRRRNRLRRSRDGWDEHRKDGLMGRSPGMEQVRTLLRRVSRQPETTVLLTGETGVGKEVAARSLHAYSGGSEGSFISVDCVALPDNLVESLLFGHEKGAFTGADRARNGVFYEAGAGTVFLDEIGDMNPVVQGKLLRVIESRTFQRVGSVREYPVRARVVAATNRDLSESVKQGAFRFDLYQRLSVFPVHVPPLRERGEDILALAQHFLNFFSSKMERQIDSLSVEVQECLLSYDFPGNVRELKNIIERAVILAEEGRIGLQHLPQRIHDSRAIRGDSASHARSHVVDFVPGIDTMQTVEEKLIRRALHYANGARAEAARLLGISRFQLLRRMQKYKMIATTDDEQYEG